MTLRRPPYWESASSRPLVRLRRRTIATVISERRGTLIVRFSAIRKVASVSSKIANFITADCHGKSLSLRRCATCCPMKRSAVERVAFISITHHTPWRSLLGEVCRVGPTLNSFDNLSKPVARRLSYSQSVSAVLFCAANSRCEKFNHRRRPRRKVGTHAAKNFLMKVNILLFSHSSECCGRLCRNPDKKYY